MRHGYCADNTSHAGKRRHTVPHMPEIPHWREDDGTEIWLVAGPGRGVVADLAELERDTAPLPPSTAMSDVTIRGGDPHDAPAMHALTVTVWSGRAYTTLPTLASYEEWAGSADPGLMRLAWFGDRLVGYVAAETERDAVLIDDLQVHPQQQRRGIATTLVAEVIAEAARRGLPRAHLWTEGDNPVGARDFYERVGFVLVREELRLRTPA